MHHAFHPPFPRLAPALAAALAALALSGCLPIGFRASTQMIGVPSAAAVQDGAPVDASGGR